MKIVDIRVTGLAGGTVEGGWADELKPEDDVHTLVEVVTDAGLSGVGSVFTSKALVAGSVEHAISGIDIALWDLMGKVCNQPVARLLGGCYRQRIKPYGSILFDEPPRLREKLQHALARGFRAIKLGWRPFGRRDARTDELLIQTARDTVGPDVEIMVDAGGSEQFWPHGYK